MLGSLLTLLVGGSGCTNRQPDDTPTVSASQPSYAHSVETPETQTVRNPDGTPAVRSAKHSPEEDMFESSASWAYEDWLISTSQERSAIKFAKATTSIEAATEFIASTDFSEQTLLIHQYNIGECETRSLEMLKWTPETDGERRGGTAVRLNYRPHIRDTDCKGDSSPDSTGPPYSSGSYESEATFIRVPGQIQEIGPFTVQV